MTDSFSSRTRFSSRVSDYVRYRPDYPPEVMRTLNEEFHLSPGATVADIGSGTGIFSQRLLDEGYRVWGVEPNAAMRSAAEEHFRGQSGFISVNGSAEQTGLPDQCVELVTAAQAFHWFYSDETRKEFARILQLPGNVLLVWNDRQRSSTPFLKAYDEFLIRVGTDYVRLMEKQDEMLAGLPNFFDPGTYRKRGVIAAQELNREQFRGRVLSSSYVPLKDDAGYSVVVRDLEQLFDDYQENGTVTFLYDVNMHLGLVT